MQSILQIFSFTFASDDDNDNSDLIECDQEVDKTPIEDYGQDVLKPSQMYHNKPTVKKSVWVTSVSLGPSMNQVKV